MFHGNDCERKPREDECNPECDAPTRETPLTPDALSTHLLSYPPVARGDPQLLREIVRRIFVEPIAFRPSVERVLVRALISHNHDAPYVAPI